LPAAANFYTPAAANSDAPSAANFYTPAAANSDAPSAATNSGLSTKSNFDALSTAANSDTPRKICYTTKEAAECGIKSSKEVPSPKQCEFCGTTLYHEGIALGGRIIVWHAIPQRCKCEKAVKHWAEFDAAEKQKKADEQVAEKRRKMAQRIERLVGKSGIKKRFLTRTFDTFVVNRQNETAYEKALKYAENFEKYAQNGTGITFEGSYGTGKTHLAVAIALALINKGVPVICKTSIELLADIKRAYDSNSKVDEYAVLDVYKKAELLIIDDLGKEQVTDWSMPMLYSILNDRYEEMRPTIITTNYGEEQLIKHLTPKNSDSSTNAAAIVSRLHECNELIAMAWADWRGEG
jgi:DNA replication protein DnaC